MKTYKVSAYGTYYGKIAAVTYTQALTAAARAWILPQSDIELTEYNPLDVYVGAILGLGEFVIGFAIGGGFFNVC